MTAFEKKLLERIRLAGDDGMKGVEIARETMNWPFTMGVLDALVTEGLLIKRVIAGTVEYACPPTRRP